MRPVKIRVLLVDDDFDAAQSLAELLQLDGHITELVHDGLEGWDIARRVLPDLVLMDVSLPSLSLKGATPDSLVMLRRAK